jgi:hypothetical protein
MGALLLCKVSCAFLRHILQFFKQENLGQQILPQLAVGCAAVVVLQQKQLSRNAYFATLTLCLDMMTAMFFFAVKEEGSWQEIGASISHFVIIIAFNVFQALVFAAADLVLLIKPRPHFSE